MSTRFPVGVLAAIALGGAAGTVLRAELALAFPPSAHGFPWATLAVNVAGAAFVGFVVVSTLERGTPSLLVRPLLATGFCGGLTTFSTFAVQVDTLVKAGAASTVVLYAVASIAGGLTAARAGTVLARIPFRGGVG